MEKNPKTKTELKETTSPEETPSLGLESDDSKAEQKKKIYSTVIGVYAVLIILGLITGYALSRSSKIAQIKGNSPKQIKTDKISGISDAQTFKDSADGVIEKGGIDGEGTHKLIRDGGPSQTAFLISSIVDLDSYAGKKVRVWGQTMAAQKAAWLMDVGKVEILSE